MTFCKISAQLQVLHREKNWRGISKVPKWSISCTCCIISSVKEVTVTRRSRVMLWWWIEFPHLLPVEPGAADHLFDLVWPKLVATLSLNCCPDQLKMIEFNTNYVILFLRLCLENNDNFLIHDEGFALPQSTLCYDSNDTQQPVCGSSHTVDLAWTGISLPTVNGFL